jgi:hypothetical protein
MERPFICLAWILKVHFAQGFGCFSQCNHGGIESASRKKLFSTTSMDALYESLSHVQIFFCCIGHSGIHLPSHFIWAVSPDIIFDDETDSCQDS